jgi:hypothetical protein
MSENYLLAIGNVARCVCNAHRAKKLIIDIKIG